MAQSQVSLLSKHEFDNIRDFAFTLSKDDKRLKAKQESLEREEEDRQFQERKAHMARLQELHKSSLAGPSINFEQEAQDNRNRLQRLRDEALLNSMDEVKAMDKLVAYAKAAYVREKQVNEKKRIMQQRVEEEKRKDLMMEVEWAKGMAKQEEDYARRKATAMVGKEVIVGQIMERELERMKEKELMAREGEDMLRKLKQREVEEIEEAEKKLFKQKEIWNEMIENNKSQVLLREEKEREEILENQRIMDYTLKKQESEDQKRQEKLRLRQEKEHETNKLREKQERVQDRNKELDDLKARRAVEKAERAYRNKEADETAKKARM